MGQIGFESPKRSSSHILALGTPPRYAAICSGFQKALSVTALVSSRGGERGRSRSVTHAFWKSQPCMSQTADGSAAAIAPYTAALDRLR